MSAAVSVVMVATVAFATLRTGSNHLSAVGMVGSVGMAMPTTNDQSNIMIILFVVDGG